MQHVCQTLLINIFFGQVGNRFCANVIEILPELSKITYFVVMKGIICSDSVLEDIIF